MYFRGAWLFALTTLCVNSATRATALYDNTVNDTGQTAVLSGNVWADDLHLSSAGVAKVVEFGYVAGGANHATISFYENDAANSIWPGNGAQLIFSQGVPLDPQSSGLGILVLDPPVQLPQDVWYAISFDSFNGAVPLFQPPFDGTSNDVLVRGDGLLWNGSAPQNYFGIGKNNFEVRIGTEIPTPGSICLLCGSVLILGSRRRWR